MNYRLTIVVVAVVAIVAGAWYILDLRHPQSALEDALTATATVQPAIMDVDENAIDEIDIHDQGKDLVATRNDKGEWVPANTGGPDGVIVEDVLLQLVSLRALRTIDDATDPAAFGLDHPSLTVEVKQSGSTTHSLSIGNTVPVGTGLYAKVDGSPAVYIIRADIKTRIDSVFENPQSTAAPSTH